MFCLKLNFMKTQLPNFLLSCIFLATTACEYFSTSTYTPQQIKKESEWSSNDQPPSFSVCEDQPKEDQFSCFKSTIAATINASLYSETLVANQEIDEEIVLVLSIDKEGSIGLEAIENGSYVAEAIPELSRLIENAVANLPLASPASKTNVGVSVDSTIKLPIRISASAE